MTIPLVARIAVFIRSRSARRGLPALLLTGALAMPPLARGADAYAFTLLAGVPGFGFADGQGTAARFGWPAAIALDAAGNAYVADDKNFVIRKVTRAGVVTTIAGLPGVAGFADGTGAAARFNSTVGITVDRNGDLLVADSGNDVIRRVTLAGVVTTVAGTPAKSGAVDGPVAAASFNAPTAVAVDAAGAIYVADYYNHAVRKIAGGTVTTLAGTLGKSGYADGPGASARFDLPSGIAVDAGGNVYVAEYGNSTVRKITRDGVVTTFAGAAGSAAWADGQGTAARFDHPAQIFLARDGTIFVADTENQLIRAITPQGYVGTIAGGVNGRGFVDGGASSARFFWPMGVWGDEATGTLWVADSYNSSIRVISGTGNVTTVAGLAGISYADGARTVGGFFLPYGVALDSAGNLIVVDSYNHAIRKVTSDGTVTTVAGKLGTRGSADGAVADARFQYPHYAVVDPSGNVYVTDTSNFTVRKISRDGNVSTIAGVAGIQASADGPTGTSRFRAPEGIGIDAAGNLYVADSMDQTVRKITPDGVTSTLAGASGKVGTADGLGSAARFTQPAGVAVDRSGNVYVTDSASYVVRKITPAGLVTTLAGQAGTSDFADGVGGAAHFIAPQGITVDGAGNLFIADTVAHAIRKVTPDGTVTTVGGRYRTTGQSDGMGSAAEFVDPKGIAVDAFGSLYVSDYYGGTIRKGGLAGAAAPASTLTNASVRANLAAADRLIVGFATSGGAKPVLVRAVGPGLQPYAGGATLASDPGLELYTSAPALVDANDNWGGSATLRNAFAAVGAFPLDAGSGDAALLRSVDGGYTAHVLTPTSGLALVELYDTDPSATARLINVSARYEVGTGTDVLVAGFVISGAGPKTVLIRGVGPTLKQLYAVGNAIADPVITVFDTNRHAVASNDNWDPSLVTAFTQVGAFQLTLNSTDAALLVSLPPGAYTAQLSGRDGGTGNGLIEVYEMGN